MKAKTMMTKFINDKPQQGELYIYAIPECDMCRLHKGDVITLRKYALGHPSNDREVWMAIVVSEPTFEVNWSDHADTGMFAYDVDSVIPMQVVHVAISSHKWV